MIQDSRRTGRLVELRHARAIPGDVVGMRAIFARRRALVALLLSGALLVCHGLFGASHVLAHDEVPKRTTERPTAAETFSDAHHAAGHAAETTSQDGKPPVGVAEYFAVLLALAGAALLAAFFGLGRVVPANPVWPVLYRRRASGSGPFPRGPSPPLLQVFRL